VELGGHDPDPMANRCNPSGAENVRPNGGRGQLSTESRGVTWLVRHQAARNFCGSPAGSGLPRTGSRSGNKGSGRPFVVGQPADAKPRIVTQHVRGTSEVSVKQSEQGPAVTTVSPSSQPGLTIALARLSVSVNRKQVTDLRHFSPSASRAKRGSLVVLFST
jgi:hypothetical protein